VISPKRGELSDLNSQVAEKQASVTEQEATATSAAAAKQSYESDYRALITLGKAVPADDDSSSLIAQIDDLAGSTGVDFIGLQLSEGGTDSAAPPDASATNAAAPPPSGDPAASGAAPASGDPAAASGAPATPTAAPATETAAADLPLGATVGSAGLPVMPYELTFRGTFFEVADFIAALNGMVKTKTSGIAVDGRLLTVDGFELQPDEDKGFPELSVNLTVTSYVAPPDQGLAAGATPAAPVPGAATPAATPATPAAPTTPTPTAAVTP
jgi:hypothetical protein